MNRIDLARQFLTRELDFARVVVLDPDEWDEEYGSSQGWALPYEVVDDECVIPLCWERVVAFGDPLDDEGFEDLMVFVVLVCSTYVATVGTPEERLIACAAYYDDEIGSP